MERNTKPQSVDPREAARCFAVEAAHNWRRALEEAAQTALARHFSQCAAEAALTAADETKEEAA